ncbi:TIGR03943 family protein [Paenibacillus antri]|uniref:TIGR03943 family protein n=1 Tax=Paenibacillus antri TaxID=2582848 RepID=A0A5R9GHT6_9BACL|nr:TIGR03943 family protein [Paenibacillus antri]TLS52363.1 TIGR03943 family protein [Paenibacillus antri]
MTIHRLLRAFVAAGFSTYIIYLVKVDALQYYIAPRMEIFVKLSAIVLMMFAVVQAFSMFVGARGRHVDCGCDHPPSPSLWRNALTYGLLFSPLVLGYFLPDLALGSDLVDKKGIVLSRSEPGTPAIPREETPVRTPLPSSESLQDDQLLRSFQTGDLYEDQYASLAVRLMKQDPMVVREDAYLEIITAIDLFLNRFVGKSVQIEGFAYRTEEMAADEFVVARMAMDCCSADATPYGFLVQSQEASRFAEDTWIRVTGTIGTADWGGVEIVKIEAAEVAGIDSPETPYVYPNYEALDELPARD